jgi:hypothetical protein
MVLTEILASQRAAHGGIFETAHPCKARSRAVHNPRLLIQRAKGLTSITALIDMSRQADLSVGTLVILIHLSLAGQVNTAERDRTSIRIKVL